MKPGSYARGERTREKRKQSKFIKDNLPDYGLSNIFNKQTKKLDLHKNIQNKIEFPPPSKSDRNFFNTLQMASPDKQSPRLDEIKAKLKDGSTRQLYVGMLDLSTSYDDLMLSRRAIRQDDDLDRRQAMLEAVDDLFFLYNYYKQMIAQEKIDASYKTPRKKYDSPTEDPIISRMKSFIKSHSPRLSPPPPPPPLKPVPIVDYGPTMGERVAGIFKGPIETALDKDLAAAGINKKKGFFRDPMDDTMDEIEKRLTKDQPAPIENKGQTLLDDIHRRAEERSKRAAIRQVLSESDLLDPDKIKDAAKALKDADTHEIMQWGWDVEKMFARRQDELHDEYINGGVKAKSQTRETTARITKLTTAGKASVLKKMWLRAVRDYYDDAMTAELKNQRGDYFSILSSKERFATTLGFIADLERAVEDDITIAQDQLGFCSEASQEMDYYYHGLKAYDRELKKMREPIIAAARAKHEGRFDAEDSAMRQMHEREVLDAGSNIDERANYLGLALAKCEGEYGVYMSAIEHEKMAIDALQKLLRERLPKLESAVKRGMKILDDQDAIKARGAGRGVDIADIEFDFTPEQAEAELQSIAAQVTLQIDVVEKLHAAIMHDEALAIEGKEPKALLEATQTFLLEDQRVLALPAPSKPKI
jgi:hypothetical protein